jgi:phage-related protein
MAAFPLLSTGAVAQYPSSRVIEAQVRVLRFLDGREQRFPGTKGQGKRWVLRLWHVSDSELAAIETFFAAQQGRVGSFSFTDPWNGTVYPNCSFDDDELSAVLTAEDRGAMAMTIRENRS